jgi:hypothetical protein
MDFLLYSNTEAIRNGLYWTSVEKTVTTLSYLIHSFAGTFAVLDTGIQHWITRWLAADRVGFKHLHLFEYCKYRNILWGKEELHGTVRLLGHRYYFLPDHWRLQSIRNDTICAHDVCKYTEHENVAAKYAKTEIIYTV